MMGRASVLGSGPGQLWVWSARCEIWITFLRLQLQGWLTHTCTHRVCFPACCSWCRSGIALSLLRPQGQLSLLLPALMGICVWGEHHFSVHVTTRQMLTTSGLGHSPLFHLSWPIVLPWQHTGPMLPRVAGCGKQRKLSYSCYFRISFPSCLKH